jgi:pimeloyl-ACP methyl ester carboxylesterase
VERRYVTSSLHLPGEHVPSAAGRIWCEVEGSGDEVAVVVGGGPGVDHAHYHPWFSRLAEGRRVAYYDHPGTGRSERPREYTIELYSAAIGAVCTYVGAVRVVLIGLSFGGIPAIAYALAHPDSVDRLVLCSAQVGAAGWQAGNIDNVNRELAMQFPGAWAQLLALRARGIGSLDDEYQALLTPLIDDLEWVDPLNHPPLHRDPDRRFSLEAYRAFIGDDPEWTVGGALAAHDRARAAEDANTRHRGALGPRHAAGDRARDPFAASERRAGHVRTQRAPAVGRGA